MHRKNRMAFLNIGQVGLDSASIMTAYYLSCLMLRNTGPVGQYVSGYIWLLLVFLPFWLMMMLAFRMYDETTFFYTDRVINAVILSSGFSGMLVSALVYAIKENMFHMPFYCFFLITATVLVMVERMAYLYYIRRFRSRGLNVLVIGSKCFYEKFHGFIGKTQVRFKPIGFIPISPFAGLIQDDGVIDEEQLYDYLKHHVVDEILIAMPPEHIGSFEKYIWMFEEMGITVRVILDLYDLETAKVHVSAIGTIPMVTYHTVSLNKAQLTLKRTMDIIGAVIGLAITAILAVFIAPAIVLESRGPVIFKQKRVGTRGRVFNCYKFRSMYVDAEERRKEMDSLNQVEGGFMFKIKDDPRITKVGRFLRRTSLDELPQFFNVLKGDMSLVGTRPPTLSEVEKYQNAQKRRISIKPGITGMWQVNGRSTIRDFNEVVKLDNHYIDNWSLWMDIKILAKTLVIVLQRTGAF